MTTTTRNTHPQHGTQGGRGAGCTPAGIRPLRLVARGAAVVAAAGMLTGALAGPVWSAPLTAPVPASAAAGGTANTVADQVGELDLVTETEAVAAEGELAREALAEPTPDATPAPSPTPLPVPAAKVKFAGAPEALPRYVGQVSCDPTAKPGTTALSSLLLAHYKTGYSGGISRSCTVGGTSEHKEGRAWDWMLNASNPAHQATAQSFLTWLTGPDAKGVAGGNARRLGVLYVIWDRKVWKAYRPADGWTAYSGASPHTDHIHISLTWNGAMKRTSFWTGATQTREDYGPCVAVAGQLAPVYRGPRWTPCPTPVQPVKLGFPRSWDGDTRADLLTVTSAGEFQFRGGNGKGSFADPRKVGQGWNPYDLVTTLGDWDGDKRADLVARDRRTKALRLFRGDGDGGFIGSRVVGSGWGGMRELTGVGDFDRDGKVDILASHSDGRLLLYRGNGKGGIASGAVVGSGWRSRDLLTAVGDMDSDGRTDVVAREPSTGRLWFYPGNGSGRFSSGRVIGNGWNGISDLAVTGDVDGDGRSDLLGTAKDGRSMLYRGDGKAGWLGSTVVDAPIGSARLAS
jgi:hypothetical protein